MDITNYDIEKKLIKIWLQRKQLIKYSILIKYDRWHWTG